MEMYVVDWMLVTPPPSPMQKPITRVMTSEGQAFGKFIGHVDEAFMEEINVNTFPVFC